MAHQDTTFHGKVPLNQKIAFGLGMLANQVFPAVLGVFMVVLVEGLNFPTWAWAILYFLPRLLDAITDPIMGLVTDNTRSKWGRRRPYILLGAICMGFAFAFMWQLYSDNSLAFNFFYFLIWSFAFYIGLTIFSVPYVASGYEMTDSYNERTSIMAVAQWIGQWAWVIAPWFWYIIYQPDLFASPDMACRELAIWVAIVFTGIAIYPAIFLKSQSTVDRTDLQPVNLSAIKENLAEIFVNAKELFLITPFRQICISTFLIFGTFNTVANLTFFVIVHYMFEGDAGKAGVWPILHGSIGALITTFLVIPFVAYLAKKIGKKRTFIVSQSISIIGYILFWFLFIPGKPYLFLYALPFFSFGIGGLFTIMMSMTSDICDLDELNYGQRREGQIGAIYWWMVKIGFALAGLTAGLYMWLVGFDSSLPHQSESSITALRIFYTLFPVIGTLGAIFIMNKYDLTEEKAHEVRTALDAKKMNPVLASSFYKLHKLYNFPFEELQIDSNSDVNFTDKSFTEITNLFHENLKNGIHGFCFSPYKEGQNIGDILSESQIRERIDILKPYTQWIRSFSCTDGNNLIPIIANENGLKTLVGAWLDKDKERNEKEIEGLISLAKMGVVDIAVVGNEVLLREDLTKEELQQYIYRVKEAIPEVPVAYVDAYYQFYENEWLVDICDMILVNCYPFWEGTNIKEASLYLKQMYALTQQCAKGKKVIITETGWPNEGSSVDEAMPSNENTMKYFIDVARWSKEKDIPYFYFSSFDESWKVHHEGDVGDRWGIWNSDEKLKF